MNIKKYLKKLLGIEEPPIVSHKEEVVPTPLSPKEEATLKKEPFVTVTNTHINSANPRNGFLELDWNEYFIAMLTEHGYQGNTEEEKVDAWFKDLCNNIGAEQGIDMDRRGNGFINITKIDKTRSEIS